MLISVVIATYNSEDTLEECLASLVAQTFTDFEVIIKDGASTDGTINIINKYKSSLNLKLISSVDSGVYHAWNIALDKVQGEWVTFFGSDDIIECHSSFEKIAADIRCVKPNVEMLFGKNTIIDLDGVEQKVLGEPWESAKVKLQKTMSVRHPGSLYKAELLRRLNGFDDSFKIIGDYDFVLRAYSVCEGDFYNYSIVKHRIGGLSISPEKCMDAIKETIRLRKKHELLPYVKIDSLFIKRLLLHFSFTIFGSKASGAFFNFYRRVLNLFCT
ncbi:TPA: glycosyltransferase [Vibrio cholerae]|uniref:glycosyltransferase n=1 Tax=Vibrio cholerae TaxID=666 RepID=UPI0008416A7D|nr:glycosyltransferase [Vibrio cholerae]HDG1727046.1 glycosyltransferase [Vibrio cholerae]